MPSRTIRQHILSFLSIPTLPAIMVNSFSPQILTTRYIAKPDAKSHATMIIPRSSTLLELSTKEVIITDFPPPKSAASCPALQLLMEIDAASLELTEVSSIEESYFLPDEELIPIKQISLEEQLNIKMSPSASTNMAVSKPRVVGHRGSLYQSLENTRHSIRLAANDCEEVEIDVFLLKCGTLTVFHGSGTDKNPGWLKEYCNVEGTILDYTYEEARKLKFNQYHPEFGCGPDTIRELEHEYYIPTLEEVLSDAKQTGVVIKVELKGPGTTDPVLELVERLNMVDQVHYSSFEHSRIKRVRELHPERNADGSHTYKTGCLFNEVPDNFVELALNVDASEVHLKYSTATKERVEEIHSAGMDSMVWMRGPMGMVDDLTHRFHDVGNEDERMYSTIMATGVRAMCVNRPDVLKQMLIGQAMNSRTLVPPMI